jgi:beta-glucosidase
VTNTGARAGDEVVQAYIRHPEAAVPRSLKELRGFRRIHLAPGQTGMVTFVLHADQLGYHDEEMCYTVHPGPVDVLVGSSSQNLPLVGRLEIVGERTRVQKPSFHRLQSTSPGTSAL